MLKTNSLKGFLAFQLLLGLVIAQVRAGIGLRAVDFFRFKDEDLAKEIKVVFHPDEGLRLRENFQKKYGARGEQLVRILGEGNFLV